ncbi:MAG: peptidoglycan-binding protein, partial [Candidatus Competibacteraceae bacterium]|nr:peptidoglycan-binding protein [Candidatus Competibacteraceae bacterium]
MKRITLATLLCLAAPLASQGADPEGNFAVKGAGLATCEAFLKERENKSNYYFMFGGWLDGYVTAVNQLVPETFDIAPWESTDALAALIENHCRRNPEDNFFMVANALAGTLMRDRLQQSSEPVEASVGDQKVMLYKSVMRRV